MNPCSQFLFNFIELLLQNSMSFLHYISHSGNSLPSNRAIKELTKSRAIPQANLDKSGRKDDPNENITNIRRRASKLKSSPIQYQEAADLQRYGNTTQYSYSNKGRYHTSKSNYIQNKGNSYEVTQIKTNRDPLEYKRKNHDSFSSYLLKNKLNMNSSRCRIKGKLKFYDLDEIAQKLASPIKLQSKLQSQEQKLKNKRNKLINLKSIQGYLQDIDKDKARYHDSATNKPNLSCLQSCLQLKNRKSNIRARSLWREKLESYRDGKEFIIPWQQNQEEDSPLMKRGHSKSGLLFHDEIPFEALKNL